MRAVLFAGSALMLPCVLLGAEYRAGPDDYREFVPKLRPGDTLLLAPGEYAGGLWLKGLRGEPGSPIVITGPEEGEGRVVFVGRPRSNTITVVESSHIVLRRLELDGRGVADHGVVASAAGRWTHHVTLEDLHIHGYDRDIQRVGISTKAPSWGWVIRRNIIEDTGTGLYLGNSDGSAPFVQGVIEHNLVTGTLGYNLQIKHQNGRPKMAGMPQERGATVVRHNVFSKAAAGTLPRPNVLVGHWPREGAGSEDVYLIYGNVFADNPSEALFQGEGNIALYNNLFLQSHANDFPALAIQPHNDVPKRVNIFYNTVVTPGSGIVIRGGAADQEQRAFANAVYAGVPLKGGWREANAVAPLAAAAQDLSDPDARDGAWDFYPRDGKLRAAPHGVAIPREYPHADEDFNGQRRDARYRGAYAGHGRNPGWRPRLERKPAPR